MSKHSLAGPRARAGATRAMAIALLAVVGLAQRTRLRSLRDREAFGSRDSFGGREMRGPPPRLP